MRLRSLMIASAFVVSFAGISGVASAQDRPRENTDRPGSDFRNALRGSSQDCQEFCARHAAAALGRSSKPASTGHLPVVF